MAYFHELLDTESIPMRKILFAVLLAVPIAGVVCAQEVTGAKADAVKNEIMKIEYEKVAGFLRGGSEPVDWIVKCDAENIAQTSVDGSTPNKAQIEAGLQSGVFKMHSMKQDGHRFRVDDDMNVTTLLASSNGMARWRTAKICLPMFGSYKKELGCPPLTKKGVCRSNNSAPVPLILLSATFDILLKNSKYCHSGAHQVQRSLSFPRF
jgi:hypothetical protein